MLLIIETPVFDLFVLFVHVKKSNSLTVKFIRTLVSSYVLAPPPFDHQGVLAGISTVASASTDERGPSTSTEAHTNVALRDDDNAMPIETKRTLVQAAIQAYDGKIVDAAHLYLRAGPLYAERAVRCVCDVCC